MEVWQKDNIIQNLKDLVELINCESLFLSALQSKGVLSKVDVAELEIRGNRYDKAKYLLDILETRKKGYDALLWALFLTDQTGPLDLLLARSSQNVLQNLKIVLQGNVLSITDAFSLRELGTLWENITENITKEELANIFLTIRAQTEPLNLMNEAIPEALPYYVPRTLSKRLHINPDIFQQKSTDVFVIKGLERPKLTELAASNPTAYSSDQRNKITARFIHLQEREHWDDICSCSKSPIHLINYEPEQNIYVLEETSGVSDILRHFLGERGSENYVIPEDEFLRDIEKTDTKRVCICDLPGMGKTLLLTNLARKSKQDCTKTVAFVVLQDFVRFAREESARCGHSNTKILHLFERISPSKLGAHILFKLVETNKINIDMFFDGFDEVGEDDVSWIKQVFEYLTSYPNLRLYVTSRPHMRHELEDALGVVAYDMLPFNEHNQVYFLSNFWAYYSRSSSKNEASRKSNIDESKLNTFAKICLKDFKESVSSDERDIAGIPLQCRLIAEVYCRGALQYSSPSNNEPVKKFIHFGESMFDMYKKYVDMKFDNTESATNTDCKQQHYMIALQVVFPRFNINLVSDQTSYILNIWRTNKLMSCGLLEEVYNGQKVVLKFIHRTIAEYLVAEFVSDQLAGMKDESFIGKYVASILNTVLGSLNINSGRQSEMLSTFLFGHLFRTQRVHHRAQNMEYRNRPKATFVRFSNSTILYFLDYQFDKNKTKNYLTALSLLKSPPRQVFLESLESCGYHNYINVFCFITDIYKYSSLLNKFLLKMSTSNKQVFEITSLYSEYSNQELVSKLVDFLEQYFNFTIHDVIRISNKNRCMTPLQYACLRRSYQLLEYFLNVECVMDGQCLVHLCSEFSADDTTTEMEIRKDMINLLLVNNANLLHETDHLRRTPLLATATSLSMIKFLVDKGANVFQRDSTCNNIGQLASGWMPNSTFHDFIWFLAKERKVPGVLKLRDIRDRSTLEEALRRVKLLYIDTVQLIIDETGMDINEKNNSAENILFPAVLGGQNVQLLKLLISLGAETNFVNEMGENLIHFAAKSGNVEALEYLLSLGIDSELEDKNGKTPFELVEENVSDVRTKNKIISLLQRRN